MTEANSLPRAFGIAGYKNSGKTTLTVALIGELRRRGYRVASVKHAHHSFKIDDDQTDSARHRRAGASQVAIVSRLRWAIVTELEDGSEPCLAEVLQRLAVYRPAHDIVLVEGYKAEAIPKIECRRLDALREPAFAETDPHVVAIAADHRVANSVVPVFDLDDVSGIVDLIVGTVGLEGAIAERNTD